MSALHSIKIDISPDAIDENRHVNNREYLKWMQDAAVAHSAAVGWPMERYAESGASWVVRSHHIEYLRPAFERDTLHIHTWVEGMEATSSVRRYLIWRERDRAPVARAETLWVFVDQNTGRPRAIPDELRADFPLLDRVQALERLGVSAAG
jgi:acyl-CoA thioester hydrolase